MRGTGLLTVVVAALSILPFQVARAQGGSRAPQSERECSTDHYRRDWLTTYAESRDQRLAAAATNRIDPGKNGSVVVHGWDQSDVLVRACIMTAGRSEPDARAIAAQVKIAQGPGRIEPGGPSEDESHHWDVSYEVWLPSASNLDVHANNGSIGLDMVHGQIRFSTVNGAVHLHQVGGDVDGSTTNGSVKIELAGDRWQGSGLHAETTNGSVHVSVPENYSAKVKASTVNGSVHVDFPITVSGELGRNLSFQLGSGGPTIEARTTNGGVYISRS
ncbi:MAG TPA: DUF4097 family beta strand repeat-containing protein [Candidatus Acidoferrum sp.]|nr:DUF4097 family beta strand repeat-containing protein [Candidatus Acidoferrum sp.]